MLDWLAANDRALLVISALFISPLRTLGSTLWAQRNMRRSIEVQAKAAAQNHEIAQKQLAHAEHQIRLQACIAGAGIVGAIARVRQEAFIECCVRWLRIFDGVAARVRGNKLHYDTEERRRDSREILDITVTINLLVPERIMETSGFLPEQKELNAYWEDRAEVSEADFLEVTRVQTNFISAVRKIIVEWDKEIASLPVGD